MTNYGYLINIYASTITDRSSQNSKDKAQPTYDEYYGKTADKGVGVFAFSQSNSLSSTGTVTGDIPYFNVNWRFDLDINSSCWIDDRCDLDLEFYNASGATVYAMRVRGDTSYSNVAQWGASLNSLMSGGKWGNYGSGHGTLTFTDTQIIYTEHSTNNAWKSHTGLANMASVVGMRVVYGLALENYTGASGCSSMVRFELNSPVDVPWFFDGNFVPLETVPSFVVYPTDAIVSTTIGTGLLNANGSPVYLKTNFNINKGETKHIVNEILTSHAVVEWLNDGIFTLTEGEIVTVGSCDLDQLGFFSYNGQLIVATNESQVVLASTMFDYNNSFASYELLDGATIDFLYRYSYVAGNINFFYHKEVSLVTQTWANKETREQANPQPEQMQFLAHEEDIRSLNKQGVYSLTPMLDKTPRGYYQSTVTVSGVPTANRLVICFTNAGQKIAETLSDNQGVYRFDHLQMNEKYMFVAQHSNTKDTPPEYLATASDWQTPTAY